MDELPAGLTRVGDLTPRVAQAVHALLETLAHTRGVPVTAAEVMIYDGQALTVQATAAALAAALRLGLTDRAGTGLWMAANQAREMRRALEDRVLGFPDRRTEGDHRQPA
jgi:hypothetical protein